jgi:hypothetical protein
VTNVGREQNEILSPTGDGPWPYCNTHLRAKSMKTAKDKLVDYHNVISRLQDCLGQIKMAVVMLS